GEVDDAPIRQEFAQVAADGRGRGRVRRAQLEEDDAEAWWRGPSRAQPIWPGGGPRRPRTKPWQSQKPGTYDRPEPLAILHREPGTDPLGADQAIWRTCLREVAFLDEPLTLTSHKPVTHVANGQRLEEGPAYQLLLEILCGLQSPMIGETQVLGQFKSF